MPSKEGLGEVNQIGNNAVIGIRPIGCKLEAVARLFFFDLLCLGILDVIEPGGIGIIFCIGTVGDHEDLHKLVKAACRPEAVPLIAVNLVEGFTDGNATALQFNMDHRQTVDEDRNIIAVIVDSPLAGGHGVLIDDLQNIVVDILFVNEGDILAFTVIALQHLYMVFLNESGLFRNAQIRICKHFTEKTLPYRGTITSVLGRKIAICR